MVQSLDGRLSAQALVSKTLQRTSRGIVPRRVSKTGLSSSALKEIRSGRAAPRAANATALLRAASKSTACQMEAVEPIIGM